MTQRGGQPVGPKRSTRICPVGWPRSTRRSLAASANPGEPHTYAVDLNSFSDYTGPITQLRFDPADGGTAGGYADIDYISTTPSG